MNTRTRNLLLALVVIVVVAIGVVVIGGGDLSGAAVNPPCPTTTATVAGKQVTIYNCDGKNLSNLNFSGKNLYGASMKGAIISGVNFTRTDIRYANLQGATGWAGYSQTDTGKQCNTVLPNGETKTVFRDC